MWAQSYYFLCSVNLCQPENQPPVLWAVKQQLSLNCAEATEIMKKLGKLRCFLGLISRTTSSFILQVKSGVQRGCDLLKVL